MRTSSSSGSRPRQLPIFASSRSPLPGSCTIPSAARLRHPLESAESMPNNAARCIVAVPPMPNTWIRLSTNVCRTRCRLHKIASNEMAFGERSKFGTMPPNAICRFCDSCSSSRMAAAYQGYRKIGSKDRQYIASQGDDTKHTLRHRLPSAPHSTVTLFARLRGWSTSHPRRRAM